MSIIRWVRTLFGRTQTTTRRMPHGRFRRTRLLAEQLETRCLPSITIASANSTAFDVGNAGRFSVNGTGSPAPALKETGALPSGVTFTDNGNGTATLAGTPAAGSQGVYPLTITASNGLVYASVSNGGGVFTVPAGGSAAGGSSFTTTGDADLAFDNSGNLYEGNYAAGTVTKVTPAGATSTFVTGLGANGPNGLACDSSGNLYIADGNNGTIYEVTPAGALSTFASGIDAPQGVAFDSSGNLYVASYNAGIVCKMTPAGAVSTFASGFDHPIGLAFGSNGNLYVANSRAHAIDVVTPAGSVSTFATIGLDDPVDLACDGSGNLYVATGNTYVDAVTPAGSVSTFASGFANAVYHVAVPPVSALYASVNNGGGVYTVGAGGTTTGGTPFTSSGDMGLAFDSSGNLYEGNNVAGTVTRVTPAGAASTFVTGLGANGPNGLACDSSGNLYIADGNNNSIYQVTPAGAQSTFVSGIDTPQGLAFDSSGNLYVASYYAGTVSKVTSAGLVSTFASGFDHPIGLAFGSNGNLYVGNSRAHAVNEVTPAGSVSTFATFGLDDPIGLAFDSSGNLYVSGTSPNAVALVTPAASVSTFASGFGNYVNYLAFPPGHTASQHFTLTINPPVSITTTILPNWTVDQAGYSQTISATGGSGTLTFSKSGTLPPGLTLSSGGVLSGTPTAVGSYTFTVTATDTLPNTLYATVNNMSGVYTLGPGGSTTGGTLFTSTGDTGLAFDSSGNLYEGNYESGYVSRVTPGGTVNTFVSGLGSYSVAGLAVDSSGNLYIADDASNTIQKVTPAGVMSTFASGFDDPTGLAFDSSGNLYVGARFESTVTRISPAGVESVFASGLQYSFGLAFDGSGNLYVADPGANAVDEFSPAGALLGTVGSGYSGPLGLAFDNAGNLYVSNNNQNTIYVITPEGMESTFASGFGNYINYLAFPLESGASQSYTVTINPPVSIGINKLGSFNGVNGSKPEGNLLEDGSGNLFGTTYYGGSANEGTVFEVQHGSSSITTLASFGGSNGQNPAAGPIEDSSGNLFGTTFYGGASNTGTVYELPRGSGTITVLASFVGRAYPSGGVVEDAAGNLFGTTEYGGPSDDGTVFELQHGTASITTLDTFDGANGAHPNAGLIADGSGNLFGTTYNNTSSDNGTLFEVQHGSSAITTLASFNTTFSSAGGANPFGELIEDNSGNLFGTAAYAGSSGDGTVFEVQHGSGTITTLANFNGSNGANPHAGLALDGNGNLFGASNSGGFGYTGHDTGDGVVFEVQHGTGSITALGTFNGINGENTISDQNGYNGVIVDASGNLFGSTPAGGASNLGVVYEVPSTTKSWTVDQPGYKQTISASGGTGSLTFSSSGPLPGGLTLSSTGILNGTPTAVGTFTFTVTATDSIGASGSQNYTVIVNSPVSIGTTTLGSWTVYQPGFNQTISASGGTGSLTFSTSGPLPPGLTLSSAGVLAGTPTAAGSYRFTVTASDSVGASASEGLTIVINQASTTTTVSASLNPSVPGQNITFAATVAPTAGQGAPTGNVQFVIDGSNYGSQVPLAAGMASISDSGLSVGSHMISASYLGDSNFLTSSGSLAGGQTVYQMILSGSGQNAQVNSAFASPLVVTILDQHGNPVPGAFITLEAPSSGASVSFSNGRGGISGITNSQGQVSGAISANNLTGSYTVSVAFDAVDTPLTFSLTNTAAPATRLILTSLSNSTAAGQGVIFTVQALDQNGNPTGSVAGPVSFTTSDPHVAVLPGGMLNSSGFGVFLVTLTTAGPQTVTGMIGSLATVAVPLTVTPGPAVKVGFGTPPANGATGVALSSLTVQVLDAFNNVVTSDNTDAVTVGVASGPGSFLGGSTTTVPVHNGVATFTNLTLVAPGAYTLSETVATRYTGANSSAFQIAPLQVTGLDPDWGFTLQFNVSLLVNSVTPALYGQGFGATAPVPSVTLTQIKDASGNPVNNPVEGSVILNPASNRLTFLVSNTADEVNNGTPILPDGTYQVHVLSSGPTGLEAKYAGGGYLDGLGSGTPGSGDYTTTFTVTAAAAHQDILWLPDTADGPLQPLEAPGANQSGGGYPLYLDVHHPGNTPITDVQVTMSYNPALLTVTSTSTAVNGGTFTVTASAGTALLRWSGPGLPVTTGTTLFPIGFISATVANGSSASPIYRAKDLLHLSSPSINSGGYAVTTSDGLHLVAYVGDTDGNGSYSSADAVLITRVGLQTDSGFAAYPLVDPVVVADTDGSGFVPADASLQVNEVGVGFPTTNLPSPAIPAGAVVTPISNNVDPSLTLPSTLRMNAAGVVTVPVNLDDAHPAGSTGLIEAHLALVYNPRVFSVSAADVHLGSLLAGSGWSVVPTIDPTTGQIAIAISSATPITTTYGGNLVTIDLHPIVGRIDNPSYIALVAGVTINGREIATELEDAQGTFLLSPNPGSRSDPRLTSDVQMISAPAESPPGLAGTASVFSSTEMAREENESRPIASAVEGTAQAVPLPADPRNQVSGPGVSDAEAPAFPEVGGTPSIITWSISAAPFTFGSLSLTTISLFPVSGFLATMAPSSWQPLSDPLFQPPARPLATASDFLFAGKGEAVNETGINSAVLDVLFAQTGEHPETAVD